MRKALVMSCDTTTAVMWVPLVRFRVSSSTTAVMIGSSPEVGSSLKSNSGSSASARQPNPFFHAAANLGWFQILETGQPDHPELLSHDFFHFIGRHFCVLHQWQSHVFAHCK